jgi:hypothetical protein
MTTGRLESSGGEIPGANFDWYQGIGNVSWV